MAPLTEGAPAPAAAPEDPLSAEMRAGRQALARGQAAAAAVWLQRAVGRAPDHPQVLYALARALALSGDRDAALARLGQLVSLGFGDAMPGDAAFAGLRSAGKGDRWERLMARVRELPVVAASRPAFTIADRGLLPEGMAYDPAGRLFYAGSQYRQKVVAVDEAGRARDFAAPPPGGPDALGEVLGMKIDAARHQLAMCGTALGPDHGGSGLFRFDLGTGRLAGRVLLATPGGGARHLFNDLVVTAGGDALVTDSDEGTVYRIAGGEKAPATAQRLFPPGTFIYPNGIAMSADERLVYIAHAAGVDLYEPASGAHRPLPHPAGTTLVGIDGLYFDRGRLVAVQNGVEPARLIELRLTPDLRAVASLRVLETRTPALESPTTGAVVGDRFYFMANTQGDAIDDDGKLLKPLAALAPVAVRWLELPRP